MGKSELRKLNELIEKTEGYEKEVFLEELGNAIHNYIKTGVKNRQLDDLVEIEEVFREKYEKCFDSGKLADVICQSGRHKLLIEMEKFCYWERREETEKRIALYKNAGDGLIAEKKQEKPNVEKSVDQIMEGLTETIRNELRRIIRDVAYLSHINMLYEFYEQEEKLRREEQEYRRISEKYQKMADITKYLSQQKRIEIKELEKQADISAKELEGLISQHEKYFNVRERQEEIQISLSPAGRKYYAYIMNEHEKYSEETLNQLIYKNCDKLMEALETSFDRGIESDFKLEKIYPEKEWALQSKYHRTIRKFLTETEETYTVKGYIIKEEKESAHKINEKNRIRIPRRWDKESD